VELTRCHVLCGPSPPSVIGDASSLGYLESLSEFLLTIDEKVDTGDETGGDIVCFGANVGNYLISG